jgi:hypothetical protein
MLCSGAMSVYQAMRSSKHDGSIQAYLQLRVRNLKLLQFHVPWQPDLLSAISTSVPCDFSSHQNTPRGCVAQLYLRRRSSGCRVQSALPLLAMSKPKLGRCAYLWRGSMTDHARCAVASAADHTRVHEARPLCYPAIITETTTPCRA